MPQDLQTRLNWMDRAAKVQLLESVGIACSDDESETVLDEAIKGCIEDGDLEDSDVPDWK